MESVSRIALARVSRIALALCLAVLAGCASFDGRGLTPGQSTRADVEAAMGPPTERREVAGEAWLYYPSQPYGRKVLVARLAGDKLIAVEQRLTEEHAAKLVRDQSSREDVLALFGQPYERMSSPRMNRDMWTWHMRRYTNKPATLNVQLSPDGVVREYYILDEDYAADRMRN